ncbi:hypothetical protein LTR37_001820 [Vermiconidia calcicola]|uniref:Uncharacterized protein n=1 Tax=Vermiconidia calcicola TaxID=1690605 RepID=A0ACC3NXQ0_9PEZI|nr:hypothetical protein LTR37_001820 [Vermiconidia calcicola]
MSTSSGLRVAQVLGISSTAFLAGEKLQNKQNLRRRPDTDNSKGNMFAQSFSTTPALLEAPAPLLAKQWKKMFDSEKYLAPIIGLGSGSLFLYLAARDPKNKLLYNLSSSALLANILFNYLFLEPINQKLERKAAALPRNLEADGETVHYLVDRWATINLLRVAGTGVAAVMACWASVERLRVGGFRVVSGAERMGR